jgi:hypothetical protein
MVPQPARPGSGVYRPLQGFTCSEPNFAGGLVILSRVGGVMVDDATSIVFNPDIEKGVQS